MVAVIWLVPELPSIQSVSSSLTPVFVSHQREAADRFDEVVPATEQTSGAAFGFDAPAARAQQAILLAVPPALDAPLDEETLTQTLVETQELAHARMARPVDLDNQFWGPGPNRTAARHRFDRRYAGIRRATTVIFYVMLRLEPDPHQRDLERGWAAELVDPAWLLGRQWQMGEHAGEDASSPMVVQFKSIATPIGAAAQQQDLDPATVPAQAVLESEPGDWWTTGRRVRIGRSPPPQPMRVRLCPLRPPCTTYPCPSTASTADRTAANSGGGAPTPPRHSRRPGSVSPRHHTKNRSTCGIPQS